MSTYLPASHLFGDTDISERVYLVQDIDPSLEDTDTKDDSHASSIDSLNTDMTTMQTATSNLDNTSDADKPMSDAVVTAMGSVTTAMAAKADLVAGKVPTSQLPDSVALGETSTTAYRGDRGKTAYEHSQLTSGNPHNVTKSDVGLGSVPNTDATARANHTGNQAISTVSGLQAILDTIKRVETYLGTTNASGDYTVTYATAFATAPDVRPQLQSPTDTQTVRITSSTTTGFTVKARSRTDTLGLLPSYANLASASVSVLVTAR